MLITYYNFILVAAAAAAIADLCLVAAGAAADVTSLKARLECCSCY